MSVNKSHSEKAIMTMYVSALCFPAVPMIAGCSGTHSRDRVSSVLHGLVAGKEIATGACGERWSRGKNCTCQEVGQSETYMAKNVPRHYNSASLMLENIISSHFTGK